MSESKIGYLRSNELFRDLGDEGMKELDRVTAMSTCERGRVFYTPGETGEVLFLLKKGRVQIYRLSPDGKKLILATLEPDTLFGEMALVGQGMHNAFAEALEPCMLCALSRNDVEWLLQKYPRVATRLVEIIGHRLMDAETRLEALAFKSISARLAALLLALQRDGFVQGRTHQDLAEMIGTYRETATLTLNDFKTRGLIEIHRKKIEIRDQNALARIAETE
ncbi:MAG: Crp/Fnr family transcriptional regulator [Chloroflexi bacterium]|nr:Crp/Fnr family transcriptional regulator [Chloroflexota bacterium]